MDEITVVCVAGDDGPELPPPELAAEPAVNVQRCDSVAASTAEVRENDVHCLVTGYELPDGTGIELIDAVREIVPDIGCFLVTELSGTPIEIGDSPTIAEFVDASSPAAGQRLRQLVLATAKTRSQTIYPLPETERDRLMALDRYDFDSPSLRLGAKRVSDLTALHFDMPLASVNVVGEHSLEFVACHGADWEKLPREDSICTYSILTEQVTVLEDISSDTQFAENRAVDQLDIDFYAGATLWTHDGYQIGTLCLYDREPRSFDEADERYLILLAETAADWIELHRPEHPIAEA